MMTSGCVSQCVEKLKLKINKNVFLFNQLLLVESKIIRFTNTIEHKYIVTNIMLELYVSNLLYYI